MAELSRDRIDGFIGAALVKVLIGRGQSSRLDTRRGGTLSIESQVGCGTSVRVRVPAARILSAA